MARADVIAGIRADLEALQVWFASRPYGWRERASDEQLRQWTDRALEEDYLLDRLALLTEGE